MEKKTFVFTHPELGWDCVLEAIVAYTKEDAIEYWKKEYFDTSEEWDKMGDEYIIHEQTYIDLCD